MVVKWRLQRRMDKRNDNHEPAWSSSSSSTRQTMFNLSSSHSNPTKSQPKTHSLIQFCSVFSPHRILKRSTTFAIPSLNSKQFPFTTTPFSESKFLQTGLEDGYGTDTESFVLKWALFLLVLWVLCRSLYCAMFL